MSTVGFVSTLRRWDERILRRIISLRTPVTTRIMIAATRLGDGWAWVLAGILIAIFDLPSGKNVLLQLGLGLLFQLVLYRRLKGMLCRPRPYQLNNGVSCLVLPGDPFSFPSGHTSCAFFVFFVLGIAYPVLSIPLLTLALLIGLSRVYLGLHYPSDVLAGAGLGSACAFAALLVFP